MPHKTAQQRLSGAIIEFFKLKPEAIEHVLSITLSLLSDKALMALRDELFAAYDEIRTCYLHAGPGQRMTADDLNALVVVMFAEPLSPVALETMLDVARRYLLVEKRTLDNFDSTDFSTLSSYGDLNGHEAAVRAGLLRPSRLGTRSVEQWFRLTDKGRQLLQCWLAHGLTAERLPPLP